MHVVQEDLPLEQKENIGMKITGDSGRNHFVIRDDDIWLVEGTNGLVIIIHVSRTKSRHAN
jgi:hypothetical protein